MTEIFDNIVEKLSPALASSMVESSRLDCSVGYFNIRGWSTLASAVDQMTESGGNPKVRLLIGMEL